MQFGVLGPVQVSGPAASSTWVVPASGGCWRRSSCTPAMSASTDRLLDIVFEGVPPAGASTTIRSYIARLRKALGDAEPSADELIATEQGGYSLRIDIDAIDAARFEASIETARRQLSERDPIGAAATLRHGLAMWRGDVYGEFAFEDWAHSEAVAPRRAQDRRRRGAQRRAARLRFGPRRRVGDPRSDREHPLREKLRGQHMLALYRAGRQVEALRSLEEYQRALVEVGLEPSEELLRLGRSIASHDPALRLDSPAGQPLRGYRVGAAMGEGAHGVVYRAVQPGVGREVAIKTIRAQLADDPEFIRRFDAEAQLVANLEHPHIVPIYDYWREPGGAYIVMRLLADNLGARLADRPDGRRRGRGDRPSARQRPGGGSTGPVWCTATSSRATSRRRVERLPRRLRRRHARRVGRRGRLDVPVVRLRVAGALAASHRHRRATSSRWPCCSCSSSPATCRSVLGRSPRRTIGRRRSTSSGPASRPRSTTSCGGPPPGKPPTATRDVETFVDHFEAALAGLVEPLPRDRELANPYRGLRAFTEVDQAVLLRSRRRRRRARRTTRPQRRRRALRRRGRRLREREVERRPGRTAAEAPGRCGPGLGSTGWSPRWCAGSDPFR